MTDIPVILKDNVPFECGLIQGSADIVVSDPYYPNCVFPVRIVAHTPVGSREIAIEIKGDETIQKKVAGIDVDIIITKWQCDSKNVSCHVKAGARKFLMSCTILDKNYQLDRHDPQAFEAAIADFHTRLEAWAPA